MILEAITYFVALPVATGLAAYAVALATRSPQPSRPQWSQPTNVAGFASDAQYIREVELMEYGCVCSPSREMEISIENERHYQAMERIREANLRESIRDYNEQRRQADRGKRPQPQLPAPVRRHMPQLPAPSRIDIPVETETVDGVRWVALENEVSR